MRKRRFNRLTNAHSKKIEYHAHAIAIYFMHYNFCKIHTTLRVTSQWPLAFQRRFGKSMIC